MVGRQFGSTTSKTSSGRLSTAVSTEDAIGSSTRPSVPTYRILGALSVTTARACSTVSSAADVPST
jgi:hypothetical protein